MRPELPEDDPRRGDPVTTVLADDRERALQELLVQAATELFRYTDRKIQVLPLQGDLDGIFVCVGSKLSLGIELDYVKLNWEPYRGDD